MHIMVELRIIRCLDCQVVTLAGSRRKISSLNKFVAHSYKAMYGVVQLCTFMVVYSPESCKRTDYF